MNDRGIPGVEDRLREYGSFIEERGMPPSAGERWRQAVRAGGAAGKRSGGLMEKGTLKRFLRLRYIAAVLVLGVALAYLSPTVSLYAGSLPMVGPFFRAIGADRGLQLAYEQGVASDLNLKETVNGVTFELLNVVADTSRTVFGFRITGPKDKLEQGIITARVFDQWGREIPRHSFQYRTEIVGDEAIFTGYMTNSGLTRKTRFITLRVESIGEVEGPWEFRCPVSYRQATALERVHPIGAFSEEKEGIRLEVESIEFHATETVVTYVFHGLQGLGRADSWYGYPVLFTGDGSQVLPLGSRAMERVRSGDPLSVRLAYEPVPEGTEDFRVVHERVGRLHVTESGRMDDALISFTYRILDDSRGRGVELLSDSIVELWGTKVESLEPRIDGNALTLTVRGTDGELVEVTGFGLLDDRERSYLLDHDGLSMTSETKMGHLGEGMHFEYVLSYELEADASEVTLFFPEILRQVTGPWEVQFSLPR